MLWKCLINLTTNEPWLKSNRAETILLPQTPTTIAEPFSVVRVERTHQWKVENFLRIQMVQSYFVCMKRTPNRMKNEMHRIKFEMAKQQQKTKVRDYFHWPNTKWQLSCDCFSYADYGAWCRDRLLSHAILISFQGHLFTNRQKGTDMHNKHPAPRASCITPQMYLSVYVSRSLTRLNSCFVVVAVYLFYSVSEHSSLVCWRRFFVLLLVLTHTLIRIQRACVSMNFI